MRHAPRLFRLLTTIWVGSLLTIGYAVAPILFVALDRNSAGGVAARLFRIEGLIGVVCAVLMLLIANARVRAGDVTYRRSRLLVAAMLLCVLVGYFAIEPFMDAMRLAAQAAGTDVGHSEYASRFGMLHGISSLFYLVESVLGLWLVWSLPVAGEGRGGA
ncbi:DUF4149 domain-containing protein [Burkholderia gladioli]|uniref:DUF4149 domain-containing protein n=1 Tax=Burkholderia gladioli TaxID=28095 RepID=UPI00164167E2|nr:DUF4149 domain-containing protein [Burkholderia gladioli]